MRARRSARRAALALAPLLGPAALASSCGGAPVDVHGHGHGAAFALRPDSPNTDELFRFDPGDVVEAYDSAGGSFKIHFTRQGTHAVPLADADQSGVPDHVEQVADVYDEVLDHYTSLGFRQPPSDEGVPQDNGGDGRFDVYLVDFGFSADGSFRRDACLNANPDVCIGFMVQENDFAGYGYPSVRYANRVLASHEFFHAVQAGYDSNQGGVFAEGTAVWATERFDPDLFDMEGFSGGYLDEPDRSLDIDGASPVNDFTYGAGVFFQFLHERFGDGVVRRLWERVENGAGGAADPSWFPEIDALLRDEHASTFADAYAEFAIWNLMTGPRADPTRSYEGGAGYASVRVDAERAPFSDERLRVFYASTHYFGVDPDGRAQLKAALVGDEEDFAGLRLALVARDGPVVDDPIFVDDLAAGATVDVAGKDELIVALINTRQEGESRRPGICVGAPDEVDACILEVQAARGGGGAPDAGPAPPDVPPTCACAGAPGVDGRSAVVVAAALGALLLRRRGRRRPAARSS